MSILYPNKDNQKTTVDIMGNSKFISLTFFSNNGKFGTKKLLDRYRLTPERLLKVLQAYEENEIKELKEK